MTDSPQPDASLSLLWFMAFGLCLSLVALFPLFAFVIYPNSLYSDYNKMVYVNTTGLTQQNFSYWVSTTTSPFTPSILSMEDSTEYSYYNLRVVEGPDTGPVIAWGPKEIYNQTKYNSSMYLAYPLNPCVDTRLIITTDKYYFIKVFRQTVLCG